MKSKRRRVKTIIEAGFAIREIRRGYYLADCYHHGKRERQCFKVLEDAKAHCQTVRLRVRNEGLSFLSINSRQRADALQALELLAGRGSLVDAAHAFNRLNPVGKQESVAETVKRYLETMKADGAREISIGEKRQKLSKLESAYGDRPTSAIQKTDLERLASTLEYVGINAKKYVGAWQSVLNLYNGTRKAKSGGDRKPASTFKPNIVRKLFDVADAEHPEMIPTFALLFFAGLRPEETQRMKWENIDLKARAIRVDADMSKTRDQRTVTLQDAAYAWLIKCHKRQGLVSPTKAVVRRLRESVMTKAGISEWPKDVARHTFATAHYTYFQDSASTCKELGHFESQDTFRRHYKGLYTADEAEKYWAILPSAKASMIRFPKYA